MTLAPSHRHSAASVNDGNVGQDAQRALAGACPVVGSYGSKIVFHPAQMAKVVGIGYHEPSAVDARRRILFFFAAVRLAEG